MNVMNDLNVLIDQFLDSRVYEPSDIFAQSTVIQQYQKTQIIKKIYYYYCSYCSCLLTNVNDIQMHVKEEHKNSLLKEKHYCTFCSSTYSRVHDLSRHLQKKHSE
jgi:hypothetical protein